MPNEPLSVPGSLMKQPCLFAVGDIHGNIRGQGWEGHGQQVVTSLVTC